MTIKITTGTYNCADYRTLKTFKYRKSALKFLAKLGYGYDQLFSNCQWSFVGSNYTLNVFLN